MSSAPARQTTAPRLSLSVGLLIISLIAALVFASAYKVPPAREAATEHDNHTHHDGAEHRAPSSDADQATDSADAAPQGPHYFGGGLWSDQLGLGALAESMILTAQPAGYIRCESLSWENGELVVTDVSPLHDLPAESDTPAAVALAVVSIDHEGPDISTEFATAIQQHVAGLGTVGKLVVFSPLPGNDARPENEFPYDWYFLYLNDKTQIVDWTEIQPQADLPGFPHSGYYRAWLSANVEGFPMFEAGSTEGLSGALNFPSNRAALTQAKWTLNTLGPYQAIPLLDGSLYDQLLLRRVLGVHANDLIPQAMASDDPGLHAAAARAIGDLADQTRGAIDRLTLLAEYTNKDQPADAMQVRYEALAACRKIGGRRAAGVAQLVESYPMDDAMAAFYAETMIELLAFGDPIPANSREGRLRRMPIAQLLQEPRDAVSCAVLLERTDLPDNLIPQIITQLGEAEGVPAIEAFIGLLGTMNPATLAQREPLLEALAGWDRTELAAQSNNIALLTAPSYTQKLRSAAAAALTRSLNFRGVIDKIGTTPVTFQGLAWIDDQQVLAQWAPHVLEAAFDESNSTPEGLATRIAAFDAIKYLPDASIRDAVARILAIASNADNIDLRFAGIRAINALPAELQPEDTSALTLTSHTIRTVPGQMAYNLDTLTVTAGRPVEITLVNPDAMEHNLVITKPNRRTAIGLIVTNEMTLDEAAAVGYIPPGNTDILFHTDLVAPGGSDTLRFIAPATPGSYDYVCTLPSHYTRMFGTLEVVAPQ